MKPDRDHQRLIDFVRAVNSNSMGHFCEQYGFGRLEFAAKSQMDLYRQIAGQLVRPTDMADLQPQDE